MLSANQMKDIRCQAFLNKPSELPGVCLVYPQTMSTIIEMGETKYNSQLGTLLLTEIDIADMLKKKTGENIPLEEIDPLAYLLLSADQSETFSLELHSMFSTFIKEDILFLPKMNSVLIGSPSERRLINSKNFRDFQDILRLQNRKEIEEPPPENETAWERKVRLDHKRVAEIKKKQAQKKGDGQTLEELLEIAAVFGIDTDKCTLYAFYSLLRRYQAKEKWEQDLQMLCAGADSKNIKTKYWGESLTDD